MKFYITTPIYYANSWPHIGTAYTTIAADMIARFHRCDGKDVVLVTGSDEHGNKVAKSAQDDGMLPQDFVDKTSQWFHKMNIACNVDQYKFTRTSSDHHVKYVTDIWNKLVAKGFIYKGVYSGWYSIRDETFFSEDELVDGKAPTGADIEWLEEDCYFFKLSSFGDKIKEFLLQNPNFIRPSSRFNEVLSFLKSGLKDLAVSRTNCKWGIPVPGNPEQTIYVWIDALFSYISALEKDIHMWPCDVHIVGKDIVRFHAVYWVALLMALDYELPKAIFAHGWWTVEGQKMSKSLGNAIDPCIICDKYGSDVIRYFLISSVSFGQDADFSQDTLDTKYRSDLVNDLSNFVHRVLSLIESRCNSIIPRAVHIDSNANKLLSYSSGLIADLRNAMDEYELHKYISCIWGVIKEANKFINEKKPWAMDSKDDLDSTLWVLLQVMADLSVYIYPIMPDASSKILDMLSLPHLVRFKDMPRVMSGNILPNPKPIFFKKDH